MKHRGRKPPELVPRSGVWTAEGRIAGNMGFKRIDGVTALSGVHPTLPEGGLEYCVSIGSLHHGKPTDEICNQVLKDFGFDTGWTEDNAGTMTGMVRCFWRPVGETRQT